jgi:hypothetical protein
MHHRRVADDRRNVAGEEASEDEHLRKEF